MTFPNESDLIYDPVKACTADAYYTLEEAEAYKPQAEVLSVTYEDACAYFAKADEDVAERRFARSVENYYLGIQCLDHLPERHDDEIAVVQTKLALMYEQWLGTYSGRIYEVLDQAYKTLQDVSINTDQACASSLRQCLEVYRHFKRSTEAKTIEGYLAAMADKV